MSGNTGVRRANVRRNGSVESALGRLRSEVERGLLDARGAQGPGVVADWAPGGRLVRPTLGLIVARRLGLPVDGSFWQAALAVQLVHDASLVHDDVVDGARFRRGQPTYVAEHGPAAALLYGDRLLTAGYRSAAATGRPEFVRRFAEGVDVMVAAEREHTAAVGRRLDRAEYEAMVGGKTGELLALALAGPALVAGDDRAEALASLGRRVGLAYQMMDDLLDYCAGAGTGKPALVDYRERRWTWVLDHLPDARFGWEAGVVADALFRPVAGGSPARRALNEWRSVLEDTRAAVVALLGEDPVLVGLLDGWWRKGEAAVVVEEGKWEPRLAPAPESRPASAALRERIPADWTDHIARHSKSFRFASAFAPAAQRERIAGVYAFCRTTDDLVDEGAGRPADGRVLDEWLALSRSAYEGRVTGVPLLDRVLGEMAEGEVPFRYVDELIEGMRMDLEQDRYRDMAELRRYTYRAASVVGLWLTELFGVRDGWVLERAAALGHAMQLTNILRDVGEDLDRGRVYLPEDLMARHGVTVAMLQEMRAGRRPVGRAYRGLVEELMALADRDYALAFQAIPALPRFFQRPVAIAARVYRGIHREIRRNGYDNLTRRAYTSPFRKMVLAASVLSGLRRERRRFAADHGAPRGAPGPVLEAQA